jgi:very-short-patch-repair endonuclease
VIAPHRIHGTDEALCVKHGKRVKVGEACPVCPSPSKPAPVAQERHGAAKVRRDGSHAEDALYAALDAAGYLDFRYAMNGSHRVTAIYQRGYPWGLYLKPRRRFQADAAFPSADLLIEVEGVAHKIGHQQKHDVVRRQLAEAAGWRVLSVLPEHGRSPWVMQPRPS